MSESRREPSRPGPASTREPGGTPRALYIHYPFCAHRCHYCDFSVKRVSHPPFDEWLSLLDAELRWWFDEQGWSGSASLDSVFVGGGTPSLVPADGPERLRDALEGRFSIGDDAEWTVETNPASLTDHVAAGWRRAGANRLSLGVQSFDDGVLAWLGRLHDARGAARAVEVADAAGFGRVNLDLIFGLPAAVERDLAAELDQLIATGVGHVSGYGLTVEARTPLARWVELGRVTPVGGEGYAAEYRLISRRLRDAGFTHYEVSNFARPGEECRHNWYYWNRCAYLGLGPSSHGYLPPHRVWNTFRWDRYRTVLREGRGAIEGREQLDEQDEVLERLWLGLRTREGIGFDDEPWHDTLARRLESWMGEGWVTVDGGRVRATTEGWLRMDELVAELGSRAGPRDGDNEGS